VTKKERGVRIGEEKSR